MRIRADFESGNVADAEVLGPGRLRACARRDDCPNPLWFYFRVEEIETPTLQVEIANADDCLGSRYGWNTARAVYRAPGGDWERAAQGRYEDGRGRTPGR